MLMKLLSKFFTKEQVQMKVEPTPELVKEVKKVLTKKGLKEELKQFAVYTKKNGPFWKKFDYLKWVEPYKDLDWNTRQQKYKELQALYLLPDKKEVRHKHIAYSMMRGKKYEQIEQKTRKDNKPNMDLVNKFIVEYSEGEKND